MNGIIISQTITAFIQNMISHALRPMYSFMIRVQSCANVYVFLTRIQAWQLLEESNHHIWV